MDLAKALKEAETGYSLNLTSTDEAEMMAYISTVLELHAKGELLHESAIDRVMTLCVLINKGNRQELSRTLRGFNNGGNWPREGANKQVISSQADSLIKISRIWAD
ncbi:hypothetical protein POX83_27245, partial [Klebsiella aerogenes]